MTGKDNQARAIYHLTGWGTWRRQNRGSVTRGYPSKSAGIESGGGSEEFEHMVEREDSKAAAICDTVIDDLPALYRALLAAEYIERCQSRLGQGNGLIDAQEAFWAKARRVLT